MLILMRKNYKRVKLYGYTNFTKRKSDKNLCERVNKHIKQNKRKKRNKVADNNLH